MAKEELKVKLEGIVERILNAKRDLLKLHADKLTLKEMMDVMTKKEISRIVGVTDPASGKAVYSNQDKRDAELLIFKTTDANYIALKDDVTKIDNMIDQVGIELDGLKYSFQVEEIITRNNA